MRVAIVVLIVVLFASPALAADPAPSCARGDALLAAGYLDDAEAVYKQMLPDACADAKGKAGLARVAGAQATFDARVAEVRRLQAAGFEDAADKKAQAIAEDFAEPLPVDIRSPDQRLPWWRQQLGRFGPPVRTVAEFVAAVLGVIVLVILLGRLLGNLYSRSRESLRLAGFEGVKDDAAKASLTAALQDRLSALESESDNRSPRWVSATEGDFKLPDAAVSALPQGQLIVALLELLDRLLWRRVRVISGTVRPRETDRGAGVTVVVATRSGRRESEMTLWEADLGIVPAEGETDEARYAKLVRAGAIWLAFLPRVGGSEPRLGTTDWRSYALFAIGEGYQRAENLEAARMRYIVALDCDEYNLGARLNLASLKLRAQHDHAQPGELDEAIDLLGGVIAATEGSINALRFRARYLQAVAYLYRAAVPGVDEAACYERAYALADVTRDERSRAHGRSDALDRFLDAFEPQDRVLLATTRMLTGRSSDLDGLDRGWNATGALYHLACFYARRFRKLGNADDRDRAINTLRRYLDRHAAEAHERNKSYARDDPAFAGLKDDPDFQALVDPPAAEAATPAALVLQATLGWAPAGGNGA